MDALSKFLKKIPIKWLKVVDFPYFSLYNLLVRRRVSVFLGESRHQLDAKNRLRVPAKFRSEAWRQVCCDCQAATNVCAFTPMTSLPITLQSLKAYPALTCKRSAQSEKFSLWQAKWNRTSRAGFILPANLKDFAKIDKNIVINGAGSKSRNLERGEVGFLQRDRKFRPGVCRNRYKYGV